MLEWLAKYVGGKVLVAVCALGCILAGIWFWRHPEDLRALWGVIRLTLAWLGFVAILPWALFFIPPRVVKAESNVASAVMLIGYLLVDVLVAFWLAGWHVGGTLAWVVLLAGFLAAGVYNFIVCETIGERTESL
ncbi:MAG: hypothetical protein JXQ73_23285 [Phycisphaerae bacterium]|nr:hypothetical protein [Phycisphaerae bacterium]